jgi:3-oxoacyl-[acyl-carrier protein] reductase
VGRQVALHLAQHECAGVAVNDYFLDRAEAVAEEVRAAGGKAIAVQADVTDLHCVKAMRDKVRAELGVIGVLVNNAGNMGPTPTAEVRKPFWETRPEVWNQTIGVNLYGVMNCTAAVIPGMIERGAPGRIITIISDAGRFGDVNMEAYAGAKRMMEKYIVRRPGEPVDVANMALFLASDASSWITGQTYPVNGGFTLAL